MDRPVVVIAEKISPAAVAVLAAVATPVDAAGDDRPTLLSKLSDAQGLIVRSATKVDSELLGAAPVLRVIGRAGVGVDNVDVDAATYAGVMVVNTPDAYTISAAEHTMALLLAQARRIPAADASLRSGVWDRSELPGCGVTARPWGSSGWAGSGRWWRSGRRRSGCGYSPTIRSSATTAPPGSARMRPLGDVLAEADFITIHLPRTRETENILDAAALAATKPGVPFVNVARGGIVDEQALADAIASGHVGGAAVDVFAVEPTTDSPLFGLEQVVVTPHLGASTVEAQDKAGLAVASAVAAALEGGLVSTAVNLDIGPKLSDEARPHVEVGRAVRRRLRPVGPRAPCPVGGDGGGRGRRPVDPRRGAWPDEGRSAGEQRRAGDLRQRTDGGGATRHAGGAGVDPAARRSPVPGARSAARSTGSPGPSPAPSSTTAGRCPSKWMVTSSSSPSAPTCSWCATATRRG